MKIALTGSTGHLGATIMHELTNRNYSAKALFRDDYNPAFTDFPIEFIKGDIMHSDAVNNLLRDCDTVIHCAALISVNADPIGLVHKTNVDGTQLVIDHALKAGIKRFIHISSIHAFKQQPSLEVLDEQRQPVNESAFAYDRSKLAGQNIVLAANGENMQVIVINPTAIIGPYDYKPSLMGKVLIDLYKGRLPIIFNGGFDFCDCRDVANAIINATTIGKPGEVYLLAGKWHSLKQLTQILSIVSTKKINPITLSHFAAKLGIPIVKLIAAIKKKEPLYTHEALEALFTGNRYISSEKAKNTLNYTTRPFEETMLDTILWFKNKGYLD